MLDREYASYGAVRSRGNRLAHGWRHTDSQQDLIDVLGAALDAEEARAIDDAEVFAVGRLTAVEPSARGWASNAHCGVLGLELTREGSIERLSPTYMLSTNRCAERVIELYAEERGLGAHELHQGIQYRTLAGQQWFVRLGGEPAVVAMERENTFVPVESVTAESTRRLVNLASNWMSANLHPNGRMTYKYWPSPRRESTANNMIRQWMASIALIRIADRSGDALLMARAAASIEYNLDSFYRYEDGFGLIEWRGAVKLGAIALAALAVLQHPEGAGWTEERTALERTISRLSNQDGSFTTFFAPYGRNDNQNFYPGEAPLYWATLFESNESQELLERIMASFE